MAPSTSSGRKSNKNSLPYEHRGRMAWDPAYKAKFGADFSSSGSEDEEDTVSEYPTGPYISGGLFSAQPSTTQAPTSITKPHPPKGKQPIAPIVGNRQPRIKSGFHASPKKHIQKQRVLRPMKEFNRDNTAKAAFRKREAHSGVFKLPRDCNEIEPNQAKMCDFLEELGVRLGSFIPPPQHVRDRDLFIWGNAEQVNRTTLELRRWLNPSLQALRPMGKPKEDIFGHVNSIVGDKFKMLQSKMKYEATVRKFQQEPVQGTTFDFTGSFLWPVDEIVPTDLLGANLEALDPLRIKFQCYITFDARLSAFGIMTNNAESVKKTLGRIQGIMKEYVARINRPIVRYYVEPPSVSTFRKEVKTVPSESIIPGSGSALVPLMTGKTLESVENEKWLQQIKNLKTQSDRGFEEALRKVIPNLRFYRGHVRMRVYFGTFALTMFRWPNAATSITFEEFMKNMAMPGTKGNMIRDLQMRKDAASIVQKIHGAEKLFQPTDNYTDFLKHVPPSFTAHFECQEYEKEPVKLEVEMLSSASDPGIYDRTSNTWSRLGQRDNNSPLNMFMIRLDGGPSWKLQATTENTMDQSRITPKMKDFAQSVKLKKADHMKVELTGEKVFEWDKTPGSMMVKAFQQKTSFRFRHAVNIEYIIEISRYDSYTYPIAKNKPARNTTNLPQSKGFPLKENIPTSSTTTQPQVPEKPVQETNWGATLWSANWDSALTNNRSLGIGEAASWDGRLATFFPNRSGAATAEGAVSEGVKEFLEIATDVDNFLNDIKQAATEASDH